MNPFVFGFASPQHIIRSAQKDEQYSIELYGKLYDAFISLFGAHCGSRFQKEIQLLSNGISFGLSTLRGLPSLGEEFCNIRRLSIAQHEQLNPNSAEEVGQENNRLFPRITFQIPTRSHRIYMFLCEIIIPYFLDKFITWLNVISQPRHSGRHEWIEQQEIKDRIQSILSFVSQLSTLFLNIHTALFFFQGIFYHISKRISFTILMFDHENTEIQESYRILGILIFLQIIISTLISLKNFFFQTLKSRSPPQLPLSSVPSLDDESSEQCTLCLEPRKVTTATSCGHLFCWNCIHEVCCVKPECPLCRHPIESRTLLRVAHYH
jgi:peroxin-10